MFEGKTTGVPDAPCTYYNSTSYLDILDHILFCSGDCFLQSCSWHVWNTTCPSLERGPNSMGHVGHWGPPRPLEAGRAMDSHPKKEKSWEMHLKRLRYDSYDVHGCLTASWVYRGHLCGVMVIRVKPPRMSAWRVQPSPRRGHDNQRPTVDMWHVVIVTAKARRICPLQRSDLSAQGTDEFAWKQKIRVEDSWNASLTNLSFLSCWQRWHVVKQWPSSASRLNLGSDKSMNRINMDE